MQAFVSTSGPAAPLLRSNIDTDVIIRIERLTTLSHAQLGPYALEALRYLPDGSEDPDFVLNRPAFREAPILLAGPNFGCGSSREGAVNALMARGVRCVIAASFGDIFYNNCFQNGLLPVVLPEHVISTLAGLCAAGAIASVDLESQTVTAPDGHTFEFAIDAMRRLSMLHGLDDIGLTLKDDALVRAWQASDALKRPWVWHLNSGA